MNTVGFATITIVFIVATIRIRRCAGCLKLILPWQTRLVDRSPNYIRRVYLHNPCYGSPTCDE
jgi:hypothetical protein